MKSTATLINIARGSVVDQDALVAALDSQQIAAAFLDVTTPEPLPADDPLWSLDNAHITMHLSGRAQDKMRSEEHTSELQSLMRISYAVFCLKKKTQTPNDKNIMTTTYNEG